MRKILFGLVAVVLLAIPAQAQQFVLSNTTISAAMTATQQTVTLASASASTRATVGAPALGHGILVEGEFMVITSVPTTGTTFGVRRGTNGRAAGSHPSGAVALTGPQGNFFSRFPESTSCTLASAPRPWVYLAVDITYVGVCRSSVWAWTTWVPVTFNSITFY